MRETAALVPVFYSPGSLEEAPVAQAEWQYTLPAQEALPGSMPIEHSEFFEHSTTCVINKPLEFILRLAALLSRRRVNLTRFRGVFVGVLHRPDC